jgi:pyruvate dehydrogenase E2 component (dihydrolipoamide acetyltransferase)
MPKLGLTMTEGTVVKWLVPDSSQVEKGQPLVVVMTKKITYEVEAPASGTLRIVAQANETKKVTEAIGFILSAGEEPPEIEEAGAPPTAEARPAEKPVPAEAAPKAREVRSSPAARRLARELGVDLQRVQGSGTDGRISEQDVQRFFDKQSRVDATPLARSMAAEEGLDLAALRGTGPGGRITEDDVLRALEGQKPAVVHPAGAIPFSGMRQAIAETMMQSLHSTAQLTLSSQADVTSLVELREALRKRWSAPISYTDLIVKAVARALLDHPLLNSMLAGEEIVFQREINVGVAVALEQGLMVPVLRQVDRRTVLEIHRAIVDLSERARLDQLSVDEVSGNTFTVTNLGMYGVEVFTPILNPPEVAILGVGRISEHLAMVNGNVMPRSRMTLSLTIDHRIVDGAPGAAFLKTLVELLEQPALIFVEAGA